MGSVQPFLKISGFNPVGVLCSPYPGVAIRLELHADLQRVGHLRLLLLLAADLIGNPGKRLDVVAIFVCNHISAGKISRRAKFLLHFAVKIGVDINTVVGGALEWTHSTLRCSATGLAGLRVEYQFGLGKRDFRGSEDWLPRLIE